MMKLENKKILGTLKLIRHRKDAKFSENPLRTHEIVGFFFKLPIEQMSFTFYSDPLDKTKDIRIITTSIVQFVEVGKISNGECRFQFGTENSLYELTVDSVE